MKLSTCVAKWVTVYKQNYGHAPSRKAIAAAERIEQIRNQVKILGQRHAKQGRAAVANDFFCTLFRQIFRLEDSRNHEAVQVVADIWQEDYMDSFNETTERLKKGDC